MIEVLCTRIEGSSHFSSGPLNRSSAYALFLLTNPTRYLKSLPKTNFADAEYTDRISASAPSSTLSTSSSPQPSHTKFSNQPSYTLIPASNLSLDTKTKNLKPTPSPISGNYRSATPSGPTSTPDRSGPDSPEVSNTVRDDSSIENQPTRHVDYLSHDWKEKDIWSSWRYIVSRRGGFRNSIRLENASWRTWAKSKYRLRTVSPETLNWCIS
jgi:hypothetical protein